MSRCYKPEYFDQNFLRFLQLRLYAVKNKHLDLITDSKEAEDIIISGLHLQNRTSYLKEALTETINNKYRGLENMRTVPIWRSHIYFAVAIFNNRVQTSKNTILRELSEEDLSYIIDELVDDRKDQEFNKKELAKIYAKFTQKKFYNVACVFLHRIVKLDKEEVKELYHFILEHLISKYNVHKGLTSIVRYSYLTVESVMTNSFKTDRGPFITMLDDTKDPEALKDIYNIWESVDDEMPVLVKSKDVNKTVLNCSSNSTNSLNLNRKSKVVDVIDITNEKKLSDQPSSSKRPRERSQSPLRKKKTISSTESSSVQLKPQSQQRAQRSTLAGNFSLVPQVVLHSDCERKNKKKDFEERSVHEKNDDSVREYTRLLKKKQTSNGQEPENTRSNNELASLGPNCTLLYDFGQLLSSQEFCDLQFIVGKHERKFVAHIAVVASRSEYLREKIRQAKEMIETCKSSDSSLRKSSIVEIKLKSAVPEAFEDVLNYMYTDHIDVSKKTTSLSSQEIVLLLMNVHRLARDFKIKRLEQLSVQFILENLNEYNILHALKYADSHNLSSMEEECINCLVKSESFGSIIERPEFETLEKTLIVQIMKRKHILSNAPQTATLITGSTLKQDMKDFLDQTGQKFCDISLLVDGELFSAHRAILAARCSYFRKMFQSSKPKNNAFSVHDTTPSSESFKSLLLYIYCGDINLTPENGVLFLEATKFYGFANNRLMAIFEENLKSLVSFENVFQILKASDKLFESEDLAIGIKNHSLNVVLQNLEEDFQSQKLESLNNKHLIDIIRVLLEKLKEMKKNFLS